MTYKQEKFDSLAEKYEIYRPRYPKLFFNVIKYWVSKKKNNILDIGSGTGIALEGITKIFNKKNNIYALDISKNMIDIGRKKFLFIKWIYGKAEKEIDKLPKMDLIISAQSFQWMNRIKLLKKINKNLNKNGIFCILQNNRDYKKNIFFRKYEDILEKINPQYYRKYRKFKYKKELKNNFKNYIYNYTFIKWHKKITNKEFWGMINSSTQVKTIKKINNILFKKNIKKLLLKFSINNKIRIDYESELFIIKKK